MPSFYHYLYAGILRVKEFNSIISDCINNEDIYNNLNRFKTIKNIIIIYSVNKRIIGITLNKAVGILN